jgi:hypothetical protein
MRSPRDRDRPTRAYFFRSTCSRAATRSQPALWPVRFPFVRFLQCGRQHRSCDPASRTAFSRITAARNREPPRSTAQIVAGRRSCEPQSRRLRAIRRWRHLARARRWRPFARSAVGRPAAAIFSCLQSARPSENLLLHGTHRRIGSSWGGFGAAAQVSRVRRCRDGGGRSARFEVGAFWARLRQVDWTATAQRNRNRVPVPGARRRTKRATKKPADRNSIMRAFLVLFWRRPTLEGPCGPTTIGAGGLNCRVRYGNGWNPAAMTAKNLDPVATSSRSSRRSRRKAA